MFVMIKHFNKWIEFVALLQNSLDLKTMVFLDYVLAHFRRHVEVLMDQGRKFIETFEALYIKILIDYYTTFKNHYNSNDLNNLF